MIDEAKAEFESLQQGEDSTEPTAPASTTPTSAPMPEMVELMLQGKPFKFPMNSEIPYKHDGKIMKEPFDKILNRSRQTMSMEGKMKELKDQLAKYGDYDQYKAMKEKYEAIQGWSEANPQDWEKLWGLFQNKEKALMGNGVQPQDSGLMDTVAKLQQRLNEMSGKIDGYEKAGYEQKVQAETKVIQEEIDTFSKNFPEVDLKEKNLDGVPLSALIIDHGIKSGIPNFKLAALDYLGDRVQDVLLSRGRNEATNELKKNTQQGIVSRTGKPMLGQSPEVDPSKMTRAELTAAAKAEFESLQRSSQ